MELVWNNIFRNYKILHLILCFSSNLAYRSFWQKIKAYINTKPISFAKKKKNHVYSFWLLAETIIKQNMKINYVTNWSKSDWKLIKKLINFEVPLGKCMNEKTGKRRKVGNLYDILLLCEGFSFIEIKL